MAVQTPFLSISSSYKQNWTVHASSYGRASWPMTIFFSATGVPVLPWFSELNETKPWVIPPYATTTDERRPYTDDLGGTPWDPSSK